MIDDVKIGKLYKLNPKYDNTLGKRIYPETYIAAYGSKPVGLTEYYIYPNDIALIVEKDLAFPNYSDATYIKFVVNDEVYVFPLSVYQYDILVQI